MTCVVAASTIWGYGALYSDVQVTLSDGSTRDMLRKAYPVANVIAAGFAGSVRIGFSLIQSLESILIPPPGTPENALAKQERQRMCVGHDSLPSWQGRTLGTLSWSN